MMTFAVIEVDDGLTIIEVSPGQKAEDVALSAGGYLVDPGPYTTLEEATSALDLLESDSDEEI